MKILQQKEIELDKYYDKSILKCGFCNTLEKDRVYFSGYEKWYCPECYEKNHEYWRKSIEKLQDPDNPLI